MTEESLASAANGSQSSNVSATNSEVVASPVTDFASATVGARLFDIDAADDDTDSDGEEDGDDDGDGDGDGEPAAVVVTPVATGDADADTGDDEATAADETDGAELELAVEEATAGAL